MKSIIQFTVLFTLTKKPLLHVFSLSPFLLPQNACTAQSVHGKLTECWTATRTSRYCPSGWWCNRRGRNALVRARTRWRDPTRAATCSSAIEITNVCVCVCVCVWERERECVCVWVCLCVCECEYVCVSVHMCVWVCICVHVYVCASVCVCMCLCVYVCACVFECVCMCTCVCMYVYVCECVCVCACLCVCDWEGGMRAVWRGAIGQQHALARHTLLLLWLSLSHTDQDLGQNVNTRASTVMWKSWLFPHVVWHTSCEFEPPRYRWQHCSFNKHRDSRHRGQSHLRYPTNRLWYHYIGSHTNRFVLVPVHKKRVQKITEL